MLCLMQIWEFGDEKWVSAFSGKPGAIMQNSAETRARPNGARPNSGRAISGRSVFVLSVRPTRPNWNVRTYSARPVVGQTNRSVLYPPATNVSVRSGLIYESPARRARPPRRPGFTSSSSTTAPRLASPHTPWPPKSHRQWCRPRQKRCW
ncbi:hypothetical protein LR48_Vigan06g067900 [Vigna angularis]|uniref:Uncharacterized protein n=1 Tax=Phaseolus angularis TaxID=3914 RepID=A0A0L9URJ1_PHAAN|nr:hypothetical protein LR48_Vigan06g067900 [Vigna angularis]